MRSRKGVKLYQQFIQLALALHDRHDFTDAAATDGSKQTADTQPPHSTIKHGQTTYGVWEGACFPDLTPGQQAWRTRLRKGRGPSPADVAAAAASGVYGRRIGDTASVLDAELYAIYSYLRRVALRAAPGQRRVLIVSDSLSALRSIESGWRGRGAVYRKRKGGATIEAINTLRASLGKVVFIWVPSHLGIPCNAYADAVASAATNAPAQTPVTALVAAEIRSRPIVYQRPSGDTWDLADGPVFGEARIGLLEWVRKKHDWKPPGTDRDIQLPGPFFCLLL